MRLFILWRLATRKRDGNRNPVGLTHLVGCGILLSAITRTFHDHRPLLAPPPFPPFRPPLRSTSFTGRRPLMFFAEFFSGERKKRAFSRASGKRDARSLARSFATAEAAVERFPPHDRVSAGYVSPLLPRDHHSSTESERAYANALRMYFCSPANTRFDVRAAALRTLSILDLRSSRVARVSY